MRPLVSNRLIGLSLCAAVVAFAFFGLFKLLQVIFALFAGMRTSI